MLTCIFEDGNKASLRHIVADTLVLKDGKILMVKRAKWLLEGGKWGIIGGFMERDETVAQTAQREVHEETGWEIRDLTLLTIIDTPNRDKDDRQNISFVYFCEATEKTGEPDDESDEQQWYELSHLPLRDQIAFDHADLIDLYQKYLRDRPVLPLLNFELKENV